MKLFVTILAAFVAIPLAQAAGPEDAIKARVTEMNAAWAKGDAKTIASFWTDDGSIINPVGMEGHGRAEVQKVIEADQATILKGAKAELKVDKVRVINPTTAFADCTHMLTGLKGPDGKDMPPMNAHVVALAVNKGGKWYWSDVRPYFFMPKDAKHGAH